MTLTCRSLGLSGIRVGNNRKEQKRSLGQLRLASAPHATQRGARGREGELMKCRKRAGANCCLHLETRRPPRSLCVGSEAHPQSVRAAPNQQQSSGRAKPARAPSTPSSIFDTLYYVLHTALPWSLQPPFCCSLICKLHILHVLLFQECSRLLRPRRRLSC